MMSRDTDAGGFTLIELVISVGILGLLTSAVAMALIVSLAHADATSGRVEDATEAQIAAAYFAADVQSATSLSNSTPACALPTGASLIVGLTSLVPDLNAANTIRVNWYSTQNTGSNTHTLLRQKCGESATPFVRSAMTWAVVCADDEGSPITSCVHPPAATGSPSLRSVTLTVHVRPVDRVDECTATQLAGCYRWDLTGIRRPA